MHTSILTGSLAALAFASVARGQTTWTQVPGSAPANRYWHAMAYDSHAGAAVLYGGYFGPTPPTSAQETWTRFGSAWASVATALLPSTLYMHAMAYDSVRQRTVLFGGAWLPISSGTWEFDSSTLAWTAVTPSSSPPARVRHAMVFDSARNCVVLFGGALTASSAYSDTWEFDGATWANRTPATSPPGRFWHAMAFDAVRQRTVLFGGATNTNVLGDTWEWDGSNWVPRFTPAFPSARRETAMAFDGGRSRVVLFGGTDGVAHLGDTWEFDGVTWMQLAPTLSPTPRSAHAMVYDESVHRIVLFGGYSGQAVGGTWTFGPAPAVATAIAFGSGCGLPPLGLLPDANGRPVIGQQASASIVDAPTLAAAMSIGWSDAAFGPFALPVTLAGIGMPGCDLLQSADVTSLGVTPMTPTTLRFTLLLPNSQSLLGTPIFLQAYAFAPGANPLEVVVSNGVAWTIGDS